MLAPWPAPGRFSLLLPDTAPLIISVGFMVFGSIPDMGGILVTETRYFPFLAPSLPLVCRTAIPSLSVMPLTLSVLPVDVSPTRVTVAFSTGAPSRVTLTLTLERPAEQPATRQ